MEIDHDYLGILHGLEFQNNDTFIDIETISDDGIDACTDARRKIELEGPKIGENQQIGEQKSMTFDEDRRKSTRRDEKMSEIFNLTEKLRNLEMENEILESKCAHKFRDFDAIKMHINVAIQVKHEERRMELEQSIHNLRSKIHEATGRLPKISKKGFAQWKIESVKGKLELVELDREILGLEIRLEQEMELRMGMDEVLGIPQKRFPMVDQIVDQIVKEMVEVVEREEDNKKEQGQPKAPIPTNDHAPESQILQTMKLKISESQIPESPRLQYSASTAPEDPFQRKLRPRKLRPQVDDSESPRHLNPPKTIRVKISDSGNQESGGSRKSQRIQNFKRKLDFKNSEEDSESSDAQKSGIEDSKRGRPRKTDRLQNYRESQRLQKIQKIGEKSTPIPTRRSLRNCQNLRFKEDSESQKVDFEDSEGSNVIVKGPGGSTIDFKDSEGCRIAVDGSEGFGMNVKGSGVSTVNFEDYESPKIVVQGSEDVENPESSKLNLEDSKVLNRIVKSSDYSNVDVKNPEFSRITVQESKPHWRISNFQGNFPSPNSESQRHLKTQKAELDPEVEILKTKIFLNLDSEFRDDEEMIKVEMESEDEGERIHPEIVQNAPDPVPIIEEPDDSVHAYIPREFRVQKDSQNSNFSNIVVMDSEASRMDAKHREDLAFDVKDSEDSGANKQSESTFTFLFANPTDFTE